MRREVGKSTAGTEMTRSTLRMKICSDVSELCRKFSGSLRKFHCLEILESFRCVPPCVETNVCCASLLHGWQGSWGQQI